MRHKKALVRVLPRADGRATGGRPASGQRARARGRVLGENAQRFYPPQAHFDALRRRYCQAARRVKAFATVHLQVPHAGKTYYGAINSLTMAAISSRVF